MPLEVKIDTWQLCCHVKLVKLVKNHNVLRMAKYKT